MLIREEWFQDQSSRDLVAEVDYLRTELSDSQDTIKELRRENQQLWTYFHQSLKHNASRETKRRLPELIPLKPLKRME
jgi:cell shape-determining protein MreC